MSTDNQSTRAQDRVAAIKKWRLFLETTPPNTSMKIHGLAKREVNIHGRYTAHWSLPTGYIQLHCERDNGLRRFDPCSKAPNVSKIPTYQFIEYQCRDCQITSKTFAVMVIRSLDVAVDVEVMKLGEYPPFSAPISSRIQKLLSKSDLDLYRKGVRAEAQGLGVGAATYFRRIVDEQWTRFVKEIRKAAELLGVEDLGVYDVALQETQFSRAVKTLKDAIPEKLPNLGRRKPADVAVSATQQAVAYANGRGVPSAGGGHPGSSDRFTGEHCGRVEESRRAPRSGDEVKEPEAATRMTSPQPHKPNSD